MTGDFWFGAVCGVSACVAIVLVGAFIGRFIRNGSDSYDHWSDAQ